MHVLHKLRSHEHCEANYLGRLEIIHLENIVGMRSSRRRIKWFWRYALSQFASNGRGNTNHAG